MSNESIKNFIKINPYKIWFVFSLIYIISISLIFIYDPLRADEKHIIETIKLFHKSSDISIIKDYPQVTPPLFFLIASLWTKLTNFSILSLRLFIVILAFLTYQFLFHLVFQFSNKTLYAFAITLLILLNPYFIGISVFVYTDVLMILFLLLAIISFIKSNYWFYFLFTALAILVRQYAIILPISVFIYLILKYIFLMMKNWQALYATLFSVIPLLILFWFWEGFAPKSGIERWIVDKHVTYKIGFLNTYLTFSFIYILPLWIIYFFTKLRCGELFVYSNRKRISTIILNLIKAKSKFLYSNWQLILLSWIITLLIACFPIEVSKETLIQTDTRTVGFIHKFFVYVFGNGMIIRIVLSMVLLISLVLNLLLIQDYVGNIKGRRIDYSLLFIIMWIVFLLVMPLSYQVWEKYLTMILPFLTIAIGGQIINENKTVF